MQDLAFIELIAKGGLTVIAAVILLFTGRFVSALLADVRIAGADFLKTQQQTLTSIEKRLTSDAVDRERKHHETREAIAGISRSIDAHLMSRRCLRPKAKQRRRTTKKKAKAAV